MLSIDAFDHITEEMLNTHKDCKNCGICISPDTYCPHCGERLDD